MIYTMITLPGGKKIASRKRCTRCSRTRALKAFTLATSGYYSSYCKDCCRIRQTKWAKANPEKFAVVQQRHLRKLKKLGVKRIRDLKKKKASPVSEPK